MTGLRATNDDKIDTAETDNLQILLERELPWATCSGWPTEIYTRKDPGVIFMQRNE
jgi:hypothetical protein